MFLRTGKIEQGALTPLLNVHIGLCRKLDIHVTLQQRLSGGEKLETEILEYFHTFCTQSVG